MQRWVQVMVPRPVVVMKDQVEVARQVVEIVAEEMVVEVVAAHAHGDLPSRPRRAHPM